MSSNMSYTQVSSMKRKHMYLGVSACVLWTLKESSLNKIQCHMSNNECDNNNYNINIGIFNAPISRQA